MPTPTDADLYLLVESLATRLRATHDRLVTAESCTGGWIAKTVTDLAGSSDWFDCGMTAYSYEAKQALLGVRAETLELHGAVSRETVVEMVSGALVNSGASIAVAVTGIAGPGWRKRRQACRHRMDWLETSWRVCPGRSLPFRRRPRSGAPADRRGGVAWTGGLGRLTVVGRRAAISRRAGIPADRPAGNPVLRRWPGAY